MSIIRLNKEFFEYFTINTNPTRTYTSASNLGITGSVNIFPRNSPSEKELIEPKEANRDYFNENQLITQVDSIVQTSKLTTSPTSRGTQNLLDLINQKTRSSRKNQKVEITRFKPAINFQEGEFENISNVFEKKIAFKNLLQYYRPYFLNPSYGFTNYNSLNFFTASSVPEDTVLLYPNSASLADNNFASGAYSLNGPFSFDFYINPRYTTDEESAPFKAGTILHLSSTYALSLITGSLRDENGLPRGYRLLLQLSHSADTKPSRINVNSLGNYPNDLAFISTDNSLLRNHWHHVNIRWGTKNTNNGTGSFIVDNVERGTFNIPSASINPRLYTAPQGNPSALCVGNYYEGINVVNNKQALFFAKTPADRDGIIPLLLTSSANTPNSFIFAHPLNAEIHEIKIYNEHRTDNQIYSSSLAGPKNTSKLKFYLPPFFTKEGPKRTLQGSQGGILETPFVGTDGRSENPINERLSFRLGVKDISLENFTRDFANKTTSATPNHEFKGREGFPRLLHLTSSQVPRPTTTTHDATILSASNFMYATGSFVKRNLTILPNDNGKFIPNFDLLKSGSDTNKPKQGTILEKFVNDTKGLDLSFVSLNNLLPTASFLEKSAGRSINLSQNSLRAQVFKKGNTILTDLVGAKPYPNQYKAGIGPFMFVHYETRNESSNEVVFFNIPNLFFGNKIKNKSFEITDSSLSGSNGKIKIKLKDNGLGDLYRADCLTPQADWNSSGKIFYNEGLIGILNPALSFFGENKYEIKFKGTQNIETMKINVFCPAGMINSSSNPTYNPLISASLNANEDENGFVLINEILLTNKDLNIIGKCSLVQPLIKRNAEKFLIRLSIDF